MAQLQYSLYFGAESDSVNIDFLTINNIYIVVEFNTADKEVITSQLSDLKEILTNNQPDDLKSLAEIIEDNFYRDQPNPHFLAAGLLVGDIIYFVCRGRGRILVNRKNKLSQLIAGNNQGSGYIQVDDLFIFCSDRFYNLFSLINTKSFINKYHPKEIIDAISPILKEKNDTGSIAIFIKINQPQVRQEIEDEEIDLTSDIIKESKRKPNLKDYFSKITKLQPSKRGRLINLLSIIIIIIILIFSVVFGYGRHKDDKQRKEIESQIEAIETILSASESEAEIDLNKANQLLDQANSQYLNLIKTYPKLKLKTLDQLGVTINNKMKSIKKQSLKKHAVFFDLQIISEKAVGDKFYQSDSVLYILDKSNSNIYNLDVNKKSHLVISNRLIKEATDISGYDNNSYFITLTKGIYRSQENKFEKIIDSDSQWGNIADFWVFNGNLYLLDNVKDEIYKYLVAENGYSDKSSYIKSGKINLQSSSSIAIDSSVYLLLNNQVIKFTSGLRQDFKLQLPQAELEFDKIYTDDISDKLYLWSKNNSTIYIFNKDGSYFEQISSSIIKSSDDFVVNDEIKKIILLKKNKIYSIDL